MKRWPSIAMRSVVILAAVFGVAPRTRLGAQQIAAPAAPATTSATPPSVDTTPTQAGPRLSPAWRRTEAPLAARNSTAALSSGGSHTVTVTTLVLVLVVIIVVLLVVK